jgi:SAM-dependent methyltransferase
VILKTTRLHRGASIFEVGCGGGIHLVRLSLNGFRAAGIDVSSDVIQRAKHFIDELRRFDTSVDSIKLIIGDFMQATLQELSLQEGWYDLVFNAGVIEHYVDESDRVEFLRRKLALAKPGGVVVSIVPSGCHPFRVEQRQLKWGGYDIPEVDYTPQMLADEMGRAGIRKTIVIPHNIGGYLLARPASAWKTAFRAVSHFALQGFTPLLPKNFKSSHAYAFIAIGWKA